MLAERKLAQPGFWMAVALILIVFWVQIILSVPLGIIDVVCERGLHRPSPQLERQPLLIGCINLIAFTGAIALGLRLNRLPFRCAFPMGRITFRQVIGVAVTILGMGVLLSEVDNLLRSLLPPPKWVSDMLKDVFLAQSKLPSRIFLLIIVAPVTEELLFRGIILRGLLSRYRPAVAVGLTSLLFAILHVNPWQFFSALFLGILCGWFYLRTGSIMLCVLGHAMQNSLSVLFTLVTWNIPGMTGTPDYATAAFQPWWLDLLGLGLLLVGLWSFRQATPQIKAGLEPGPAPPIISEFLNAGPATPADHSAVPPRF